MREALIGAGLNIGFDTPVAGFTGDVKEDGVSKIFGQQIYVVTVGEQGVGAYGTVAGLSNIIATFCSLMLVSCFK